MSGWIVTKITPQSWIVIYKPVPQTTYQEESYRAIFETRIEGEDKTEELEW